jgi:Restriction endonuclease
MQTAIFKRWATLAFVATEAGAMTKKKSVVSKRKTQTCKKTATMKMRKGTEFEDTVARIQQMFEPGSQVTRREKLTDRFGHKREFDVVVRGKYAGCEILGVIECKDRSRRIEPEQVDAFANKSKNINADLRLMVSRKGFSKPAIELAKSEGVGTLSLLPADKTAGFGVGVTWYAQLYSWEDFKLHLDLQSALPTGFTFSAESVKWQGRPVVNWLRKVLAENYNNEKVEGPFMVHQKFKTPVDLEVAGSVLAVLGLRLTADRVCRAKRKWIRLSGEGFYDWTKGEVKYPPGATLVCESWKGDFSDWDEFVGEVPITGDFIHMVFRAHLEYDIDVSQTPDLGNL